MAVRPGAAQDDAIVEADEIPPDGVDPEKETALGTSRLDPSQWPGRRRDPVRQPARGVRAGERPFRR